MNEHGGLKEYLPMALTIFISILVFQGVEFLGPYFYRVYHHDFYLSFHNVLEFSSVFVAFSIFTVTFYTFQRSRRLRPLIIACVFLAVALLDAFHTLSYKGMPPFFTFNDTNKPTTFWIAARLVSAVGLVVIGWMRNSRTIEWKGIRFLFLVATLGISGTILDIIAFRQSVIPPMFVEGRGLTPLKINLEYVVVVLLTVAALFFSKRLWQDKKIKYAWMVTGLILCIFSELSFTLYKSVYDTYNLLGHLYKIIAYYIFFKAFYVSNVQQPYDDLAVARQKIQHYADHLEELVGLRTKEISEMNEKLLQDIDYARNIQMALLPSHFPEMEGVAFASRYIPCERIGGDFFNVVKLDEEHVGVYIGDVAGHGVSAAMITVFLNQSIKMKGPYDDRLLSPWEVLQNLYRVYNKTEFPDEIYLVMFYGIYHIRTREFTYASAGMNVPFVHCKPDNRAEVVDVKGFPICKFGHYYQPMYENHKIQLTPGEKLVFFTDGLTEVLNGNPQIFTTDDLIELIQGMLPCPEEDLSEGILKHYYKILGSQNMIDDVTLLILGFY